MSDRTASRTLCSIGCDEPLTSKQKYKARLLEGRYKAEIDAALARRLAYVKAADKKIIIGLQDGDGNPAGKLVDSGDLITSEAGNDEEITAMIALARTKGWKNLKFNGTEDFVKRATQAAADAGFEMKGYKPSNNLRQDEIIQQERERLLRARSKSHINTPKPR